MCMYGKDMALSRCGMGKEVSAGRSYLASTLEQRKLLIPGMTILVETRVDHKAIIECEGN